MDGMIYWKLGIVGKEISAEWNILMMIKLQIFHIKETIRKHLKQICYIYFLIRYHHSYIHIFINPSNNPFKQTLQTK